MPLYKGSFNWKGEKREEWVRAHSKDQAFRLMSARMAVALGKTSYDVRTYFLSKANSFDIQEVREDGK
jgi:hypothetical protein